MSSLPSLLSKGRLWKSAIRGALETAKDYYTDRELQHLASAIDLKTIMQPGGGLSQFSFFHRHLARIMKYTRRGINILHLPCWWYVWIGVEYVKGLPYRRTDI